MTVAFEPTYMTETGFRRFDNGVDENGEEYRFYLTNWKLKQDMVKKRKNYLESLNSWP